MGDHSQDDAHLYVAYFELTKEEGPHRRRRQWVVFPPMPARLAPGDAEVVEHFTWFERAQSNQKHRAIWRYHLDVAGDFKDNLERVIQTHLLQGWTFAPVITCEIHPTELAAIHKQPRTPYRILSRLAKVARGMHRLDIS